MKLTRSQKIWIGMLGVGLSALAIDRAIGHGGPAVAAEIESITASTAVGVAGAARTDSAMPNVHQQLADRLSALARSADPFAAVRDAFKPTGNPALLSDSAVAEGANVSPASFIASHKLKAILRNGGRQQAWVNESLVGVGQMIDGARLLAADGLNATFDLNGTRFDLVLPDPTKAYQNKSTGKSASSD